MSPQAQWMWNRNYVSLSYLIKRRLQDKSSTPAIDPAIYNWISLIYKDGFGVKQKSPTLLFIRRLVRWSNLSIFCLSPIISFVFLKVLFFAFQYRRSRRAVSTHSSIRAWKPIFLTDHKPMIFVSLLLIDYKQVGSPIKKRSLQTMRLCGHPNCRAAPFELVVIDLITQHDEKTNKEFPRRGNFGNRLWTPCRQSLIKRF